MLGSYYFIMGTCKQRPCAFCHPRNAERIMKSERRRDQRWTYSARCLETSKCQHKFSSLVPISSVLSLFGVAAVIPVEGAWVTYSLWGWQCWSHVPIVFIPDFHLRMQVIPSHIRLKIKHLMRSRIKQLWKSYSTLHWAHVAICQMWQTVYWTTHHCCFSLVLWARYS